MKVLATSCLLCAAALLSATGARAEGQSDYALNDGGVHFRAPSQWSAIMEKKEGNPQAIAFQVPDPSAQGSDTSATVTVKTRQLEDAGKFAASVQEEFERARAQSGFEIDPANKDASIRQYFVTRGKTRYLVRDSARLSGTIAVEVRCQRPLLADTPAAWAAQFDRDCAAVVSSLGL